MYHPVRKAITVPDGRVIFGQYPGVSAVRHLEHVLRDRLARQVDGATEACLPYGRADVLTSTTAFEVEPRKGWRHGVRQALAYSAQTGCKPGLALFGAIQGTDLLKLYIKLRDGNPPIELWWYEYSWDRITNRSHCRNRKAPVL